MTKKRSQFRPRQFRSAPLKRHRRPKQDVPLIPTVLEGGGLLLGVIEAAKGNIGGGAVVAGTGLVGGYVLEKIGNNTKIGKIKLKTKRHAVSLI